jgi:isopentenyldiphosphate isomerase
MQLHYIDARYPLILPLPKPLPRGGRGLLQWKIPIFIAIMNNLIPDEWFPIIDNDGNEISRAHRSVCHDGKSKLLHPVVHMHLFNSKGELFLQKRSLTKDLLPGYWDTSVGGHISPGESANEALKRETLEELGLKEFTYKFLKKYIWESPREKELVYSFKGSSENHPNINLEEIEEGRFWTFKDIEKNLGKNVFTPNFEYEYNLLNPILKNLR